ncbi:MAG: hypothetical protein AAF842_01945 [Planctomycetota bacterium]
MRHYSIVSPFSRAGLIGLLVGMTLFAGCATTPTVKQEFMFQVIDLHTPRQYGQTMDLYIKYRYRDGLPSSAYPDYRKLRTAALDFIKIRPAEPALEYWEILNGHLVEHLYASFPLSGVSSQMLVHPHEDEHVDEPGYHASIATVGEITPLDFRGPSSELDRAE